MIRNLVIPVAITKNTTTTHKYVAMERSQKNLDQPQAAVTVKPMTILNKYAVMDN